MPYSKAHKNATRQKILTSAITLFSTKGFDCVSIDELMSHAGLTRGAFYSHFAHKQALYTEAIIAGAKRGQIAQQKPSDFELQEWISHLVSQYMSEEHIKQRISPCPLAFLVTDIANSQTEVKDSYTRIFKHLNDAIYTAMCKVAAKAGKPEIDRSDVYAAMTMMIGSVAIGRALNDDKLMEELLEGTRKNVLKLLKL